MKKLTLTIEVEVKNLKAPSKEESKYIAKQFINAWSTIPETGKRVRFNGNLYYYNTDAPTNEVKLTNEDISLLKGIV